jgi:hypothetical protein
VSQDVGVSKLTHKWDDQGLVSGVLDFCLHVQTTTPVVSEGCLLRKWEHYEADHLSVCNCKVRNVLSFTTNSRQKMLLRHIDSWNTTLEKSAVLTTVLTSNTISRKEINAFTACYILTIFLKPNFKLQIMKNKSQ